MPDKKIWPSQIFATSKLDYIYTQSLTKQQWAWEFLRRNPDYHRAFVTSRARLTQIIYLANNIPVMRPRGYQTGVEDWGLACFSDPAKSAYQMPVFWSKESLRHSSIAKANPLRNVSKQADLDVYHQSACIAVLENRRGNNVLVRTGRTAIDLRIEGINILLKSADLSFRIDGTSNMKHRSETLIMLANALSEIPKARTHPVPKPTRQSLLKALVALDCNLNGGSLQGTANVFRALNLTRLSWSTNGDESLKKQVIRARNRGLKLMKGGYKSLLR